VIDAVLGIETVTYTTNEKLEEFVRTRQSKDMRQRFGPCCGQMCCSAVVVSRGDMAIALCVSYSLANTPFRAAHAPLAIAKSNHLGVEVDMADMRQPGPPVRSSLKSRP
jgi:hypothetical protein